MNQVKVKFPIVGTIDTGTVNRHDFLYQCYINKYVKKCDLRIRDKINEPSFSIINRYNAQVQYLYYFSRYKNK